MSDVAAMELGALRQWRSEIHAGYRGQRADRPSSWRSDALYRAAALEAMALDAQREGRPVAAALYIEEAARAIADAVVERGT